eukprot:PhM_4_TR10048/c1_g1_i2/m.99360
MLFLSFSSFAPRHIFSLKNEFFSTYHSIIATVFGGEFNRTLLLLLLLFGFKGGLGFSAVLSGFCAARVVGSGDMLRLNVVICFRNDAARPSARRSSFREMRSCSAKSNAVCETLTCRIRGFRFISTSSSRPIVNLLFERSRDAMLGWRLTTSMSSCTPGFRSPLLLRDNVVKCGKRWSAGSSARRPWSPRKLLLRSSDLTVLSSSGIGEKSARTPVFFLSPRRAHSRSYTLRADVPSPGAAPALIRNVSRARTETAILFSKTAANLSRRDGPYSWWKQHSMASQIIRSPPSQRSASGGVVMINESEASQTILVSADAHKFTMLLLLLLLLLFLLLLFAACIAVAAHVLRAL